MEELKKLKKSNIRLKRILICALVFQHVFFIYGCFLLIIGEVFFGAFHVIINGIAIPYNFKAVKSTKVWIEVLNEAMKTIEEIDEHIEKFKKLNESIRKTKE